MEGPKLLAEFQLDERGSPVFSTDGDVNHYQITLYIPDPPSKAYSVTYELDESYVVARRVVPRTVPEFRECITSYGDYIVKAAVMTKDMPSAPIMVAEKLSEALRRKYAEDGSPKIQAAIQDIADH